MASFAAKGRWRPRAALGLLMLVAILVIVLGACGLLGRDVMVRPSE
jgi:hypothetical protein